MVGLIELWVKYSRANGASFCQVVIISAVFSEVPCRTSGNQKCRGARPSFIASAIVSMMQAGWFVNCVISQVLVDHALIVLANRSVAEAAAWVRKYFAAASVARGWCCLAIRGMMARVFSSSPIQARSQWVLDRVMIVPIATLDRISDVMKGFISIGRILTNIFGVWARKLN